jgi:hypothetical protein
MYDKQDNVDYYHILSSLIFNISEFQGGLIAKD